MWTPTTRRQHGRSELRCETDLTDAQWSVIEPWMPQPAPCGRPPIWTMRAILNAIFCVLRGGIAWRLIPKDLPPRSTTYGYFSRWRDDGLFGRINHHLVMADRERVGREASPSAAVPDSQRIKTTESGGPRGYDAGKKVKGRKRQALVDTDGRALVLDPQPADVQDRDGAVPVLRRSRRTFPSPPRRSPMRVRRAIGLPQPRASMSRSCASRPDRSASPSSRAAITSRRRGPRAASRRRESGPSRRKHRPLGGGTRSNRGCPARGNRCRARP